MRWHPQAQIVTLIIYGDTALILFVLLWLPIDYLFFPVAYNKDKVFPTSYDQKQNEFTLSHTDCGSESTQATSRARLWSSGRARDKEDRSTRRPRNGADHGLGATDDPNLREFRALAAPGGFSFNHTPPRSLGPPDEDNHWLMFVSGVYLSVY